MSNENKTGIYEKCGFNENPFPRAGAAPANPIRPVGVDGILQELEETYLDAFEEITSSTAQSRAYTLVGSYGGGKSTILNYLRNILRDQAKEKNILIGSIRGTGLTEKIERGDFSGSIYNVFIQSLGFSVREGLLSQEDYDQLTSIVEDPVSEDEFLPIIDYLYSKLNINWMFIFLDETERLSKHSGIFTSLREFIDLVPRVNWYIGSTPEAWREISRNNPFLVDPEITQGRVQVHGLPPFHLDMATKTTEMAIESVKKDTSTPNPFQLSSIRSLWLASRGNGRIYNVLAHKAFFKACNDGASKGKAENVNSDLNLSILSEKIQYGEYENYHIFNSELYSAVLNEISRYGKNTQLIFSLLIGSFNEYEIEDIVDLLKINRTEVTEAIMELSLSSYYIKTLGSVPLIHRVYRIDHSKLGSMEQIHRIAEESGYDDLFPIAISEGGLGEPRITFLGMTLEQFLDCLSNGDGSYYIPSNPEDFAILINTIIRKEIALPQLSSLDTRRIINFFDNIIKAIPKDDKRYYRITERAYYKLFNMGVPLGFDPWKIFINEEDRIKIRKGIEQLEEQEINSMKISGLYRYFVSQLNNDDKESLRNNSSNVNLLDSILLEVNLNKPSLIDNLYAIFTRGEKDSEFLEKINDVFLRSRNIPQILIILSTSLSNDDLEIMGLSDYTLDDLRIFDRIILMPIRNYLDVSLLLLDIIFNRDTQISFLNRTLIPSRIDESVLKKIFSVLDSELQIWMSIDSWLRKVEKLGVVMEKWSTPQFKAVEDAIEFLILSCIAAKPSTSSNIVSFSEKIEEDIFETYGFEGEKSILGYPDMFEILDKHGYIELNWEKRNIKILSNLIECRLIKLIQNLCDKYEDNYIKIENISPYFIIKGPNPNEELINYLKILQVKKLLTINNNEGIIYNDPINILKNSILKRIEFNDKEIKIKANQDSWDVSPIEYVVSGYYYKKNLLDNSYNMLINAITKSIWLSTPKKLKELLDKSLDEVISKLSEEIDSLISEKYVEIMTLISYSANRTLNLSEELIENLNSSEETWDDASEIVDQISDEIDSFNKTEYKQKTQEISSIIIKVENVKKRLGTK